MRTLLVHLGLKELCPFGGVRFVPCVDGALLARIFLTIECRVGRCGHVFDLLKRRERPLAMMPSAKQIPTKSTHSKMPWHEWVVPLPGYRPAQCIIVS